MRKLLLIKTQDAFVRLLLSSYGKNHLLRNRLTGVSPKTMTGRLSKMDGLEIKKRQHLDHFNSFWLLKLHQSVHFLSSERPVWTKTVQFGSRPSSLDQDRPVWIKTVQLGSRPSSLDQDRQKTHGYIFLDINSAMYREFQDGD